MNSDWLVVFYNVLYCILLINTFWNIWKILFFSNVDIGWHFFCLQLLIRKVSKQVSQKKSKTRPVLNKLQDWGTRIKENILVNGMRLKIYRFLLFDNSFPKSIKYKYFKIKKCLLKFYDWKNWHCLEWHKEVHTFFENEIKTLVVHWLSVSGDHFTNLGRGENFSSSIFELRSHECPLPSN